MNMVIHSGKTGTRSGIYIRLPLKCSDDTTLNPTRNHPRFIRNTESGSLSHHCLERSHRQHTRYRTTHLPSSDHTTTTDDDDSANSDNKHNAKVDYIHSDPNNVNCRGYEHQQGDYPLPTP